mmetsp:Transcript_20011/g.41064  ORF Transcript_20011/g.41064 Transcript_20011/m.41064 type:complete len:318 (+) Transcript_20011:129-1082(+)
MLASRLPFSPSRILRAKKRLMSTTMSKAAGQAMSDGSSYENYHEAARVYDGIRHAGGYEVILGAWAAGGTGVPLHKQRVLDIGCGTGNYAAAVAPHVGSLTCMDGNASMLAKCEQKLTGVCGTPVTFQQNLLPSLAVFEDNSFDAAMCNLVVHHIEDDATRPSWANLTTLVREAKRVLKPGGVVCFNHITPEQVDAYWFLRYVPECKERWRSTLVPGADFLRILGAAGFERAARTTPLDYVLFQPLECYLDPSGPLDPDWRRSTSMWSVGEGDELAVALHRIAADGENGIVHNEMEASEAVRRQIGHTCFFYGVAGH